MTEEDIKKLVYEKTIQQIQNAESINDKEGYALFTAECEITFRGLQRCKHHKKQFMGLDISSFLNLISKQEIEHVVILAILNKEIKDSIVFSGEESSVPADRYFFKEDFHKESAVDFITRWYEKGARICNYHNHPDSIAAIPSINDIDSLSSSYPISQTDWQESVEKFNKDLPNGFKYDDWGIVTPFDFFSFQQEKQNGHSTEYLYKQCYLDAIKLNEGRLKYYDECSLDYVNAKEYVTDLNRMVSKIPN